MSEAPRLAIVLPAYNEAERIGPALDELFTYLVADTDLPRPIEGVVVDDGSLDATPALVGVRPVAGPVKDTQCGFKGFTRGAARDLFAAQRIRSIVFDVELIYLARRRGYRIAIVPVQWADRRGSRMRPRLSLATTVAWDLFRIPLLHRGVRRIARSKTPAA